MIALTRNSCIGLRNIFSSVGQDPSLAKDEFTLIDVRVAAIGQDLIGWTEFSHGKVLVEIASIQNLHCMSSPSCRLTGADWMKTFISHLLQVSYSQWIFWNYTLHDKQWGNLHLCLCADALCKIHKLLETPLLEVPPESQYLLELDHSDMYNVSYEEQAYWDSALNVPVDGL